MEYTEFLAQMANEAGVHLADVTKIEVLPHQYTVHFWDNGLRANSVVVGIVGADL